MLSLTDQPKFEEEYLKKSLKDARLEDMVLNPKQNNRAKLSLFRILAILMFFVSIIVIIT